MAAVSISVIGSFRKHYQQVVIAVQQFEALGLDVRSPAVSRIINPGDEYVRFETDPPDSSDQAIQAVTMARILSSDIVYVVSPGGYIGRTTCYELGRVQERAIPVYFSARPGDLPLAVHPGRILPAAELGRMMAARSGPAVSLAAR